MESDPPKPAAPSFLRRNRVAIIVIVFLIVGVIIVARLASSGRGSSRHESITMVSLPPPPPPPPPPVMTPPPQEEEQRMEQPMIKEDQPKAPEPPKDEPIGTSIKGEGSDSFGLGSGTGNGSLGGKGNGSRWGWYASQVSSRIQQTLQQNRKTRTASMNIKLKVWPDATGRIVRAQVAGTTGDSQTDAAVKDALTGLQLEQPPPADMPAPIVLRVAAQRPH